MIISIIISKTYTIIYNCNVYVFMRVKNEENTIINSLNTLLPYINHGVIGYNDNSDNSESIIHDFCSKHINYKYLKYDYSVIPVNSKLYLKNQPYENRLDGYYNTVLTAIPNNNWLLKADADELYNSYLLYNISFNKKYRKFLICLPRVNIYLINCTFYALKKKYKVNPCDQWLFYKTGEEKFVMKVYNNSRDLVAYEFLIYGNRKLIYYQKIAILHLSHVSTEIKKKYMNNEMINLFNLISKENETIIINNEMKNNLYDLAGKCKVK